MVARQRRKPITVIGTHAADTNFQAISAHFLEFCDQLPQSTGRQWVAVRMCEHDLRAALAQATERLRQRRPTRRYVPGPVAPQPSIERVFRTSREAGTHQRARQMHASRHNVLRQQMLCQRTHRQPTAALQSLGDGANAVTPPLQHVRNLRLQRSRSAVHTQSQYMHSLAPPVAGQLNTWNERDAECCASDAGFRAAHERVVIGER